jgi:hypothetical protein
MKTLIASVALAAAIASPALAQTANGGQSRYSSAYASPYANSYGYMDRWTRSNNPAHDVYSVTGHYLGSDPDPAVRNQLARDPANGD